MKRTPRVHSSGAVPPPVTTRRQSCAKSTVRTMCLCGHMYFSSPVRASHSRAEKSAEPVTPSMPESFSLHDHTAPCVKETCKFYRHLQCPSASAITESPMPESSMLRSYGHGDMRTCNWFICGQHCGIVFACKSAPAACTHASSSRGSTLWPWKVPIQSPVSPLRSIG